jgi:transposase
VFSINPKQLDRFRDRFSVAGAKDDSRDALVLARSLRTDPDCFRRLRIDDPRLIRLRELSRAEESYQQDLRRAANQLWSLLQRYFPALLALCPAADEPWLWSLLEHVKALPSAAAKCSAKQLEAVLRQHRIRRFQASELLQGLQQPLPLAPGVAAALAEQVLLLLPRLRLLDQQLRQLAQRIEKLLEEISQDDSSFSEHRTVQILRSIPGVGSKGTVAVLTEGSAPLAGRDYHTLRALCGIAPVTQQSGKTKLVCMRRACNQRLRHALFHCANVHMQHDARARALYTRHRQKGQNHARALRSVGDRLLALILTLVRKQILYDPALRLVASSQPSD